MQKDRGREREREF